MWVSALYFIRTQHLLCVFCSHLVLTTTQFIKSTDCSMLVLMMMLMMMPMPHALLMLHVIDAALVGKQMVLHNCSKMCSSLWLYYDENACFAICGLTKCTTSELALTYSCWPVFLLPLWWYLHTGINATIENQFKFSQPAFLFLWFFSHSFYHQCKNRNVYHEFGSSRQI